MSVAKRATVIVLLALAAVLGAAPAVAQSSETSPSVALSLSAWKLQSGDRLVALGHVQPLAAGETITVEIAVGDTWLELGSAVTDVTGSFAVELRPTRGGAVRARSQATGAVSEPVELSVEPAIRVRASEGVPFGVARLTVRIVPSTYTGPVSIVVRRRDVVVGRTDAAATNGRVTVRVPTPGAGRFVAVVTTSALPGLVARSVAVRVAAPARTLSWGATGRPVRSLAARLHELGFQVPAGVATFDERLRDAVVAFQKAYGLDRTGVVDARSWNRLGTAERLRPRYTRPGLHIEVDKTRQILLVVRKGRVEAILPVSTGATGNTPEGRHQIRWKAPATTTWLGSGILYRTLTFFGDSFAIHGWPDVPVYPASHGCVRIPIWTADWLYERSPVGETVYVYR